MTQPSFSFIIPVRNDARRLQRCLATIRACRYPAERVEIIVIDNGSTDDSAVVARDAGARVLTLPSVRVSEARNQAALTAGGDVLAFVDADHEIGPEWLASAAETLAASDVIAAGALCHPPRDGTWVQRQYDAFRDHRSGVFETQWLGSGNLAVKAEAFRNVAGFDTSLETCEDVDLCRRLRRAGGRILNDSRMLNVHLGDPATLGALFWGEMWRGRDNIRASLRPPFAWREVPSVAIPVVQLLLWISAGAGLVFAWWGGWRWTLIALAGVLALSALRAGRMLGRLQPRSLANAAGAYVVAFTYDLGRALALVSRVGHRTRQAKA